MPTPQVPQDYVPVFLQIVSGLSFAVVSLGVSYLLGKRGRHNAAKDMPYECGKDPIGPTHSRFSIKFYLVAMLFILFDIEVVFMYPWAVVYRELLRPPPDYTKDLGVFYAMFSFIGILVVGYLYALKKKAFDWTHTPTPPVPMLSRDAAPITARVK
jgi:NADH-quinone oxidoreductase subunit A